MDASNTRSGEPDPDDVIDERSLVNFMKLLADEDRSAWENITIQAFLHAAAAWADSTTADGFYSPPGNIWTRFAQMLLMGTRYE